MHLSAYICAHNFFDRYISDAKVVVEIGSMDINGSLRDLNLKGCKWIGVDNDHGPGVNVVNKDLNIPFEDGFADVTLSSSTLEHDVFFWHTFTEMVRITKPGGYVYINAPSNGPVHRHPVDCWRFYPDAATALLQWARHAGYKLELIETDVNPPHGNDIWADFYAIYRVSK